MMWTCECGGTFHSVTLKDVDLRPYFGLTVTLEEIEGIHCDKCGRETLPGTHINSLSHILAATIIDGEGLLHPAHAVYLRKYLQLTQQELADLLVIDRATVNRWEKKGPASTYDRNLRAIVLGRVSEKALWMRELLWGKTRHIFEAVRKPAPKRPPKLDLAPMLKKSKAKPVSKKMSVYP